MNDRKTDNLLNAIGALPDFLIEESAEGSEEMKNRNITKWATIAAVFVFVALTCVIFAIHGNSAVVTPSNTDRAASESDEVSAPESDTAAESTSAPESTSEPETTETEPPEEPKEPEISSEVFRTEGSMINFPVTPKSEEVKNMLVNGDTLDAEDDAPHCPVFAVRTVGELDLLREEIMIPDATVGYDIFASMSEQFDNRFFSKNTLYVSFVEAPAFEHSTARTNVKDLGDTIEISFGFTVVSDFSFSMQPYCVFLTVPNSRAEKLLTVDCTFGSGEYDHIATVRGVVTEVSENTATLRLIGENGDIFSGAGTVTFGFSNGCPGSGNAIEIAYNYMAEGNTDGHIEKILAYKYLTLDDLDLPEAVGQHSDTKCFIDTKEGYDLMKNSELCIRNCSPDDWTDSVFGISSTEELAEFCRLLIDAMRFDPYYSPTGLIYSTEILDKIYTEEYGRFSEEYNEEFFKSHSLLIMYDLEGDNSRWYRPTKLEYGDDGTITVGLCHVTPSIMLCEEGAVCVFVPVEKDALKNCTGVSIECVEVFEE